MNATNTYQPVQWQVVLYNGDYVDTVKFHTRSAAETCAREWKKANANHSAIVESAEQQ